MKVTLLPAIAVGFESWLTVFIGTIAGHQIPQLTGAMRLPMKQPIKLFFFQIFFDNIF